MGISEIRLDLTDLSEDLRTYYIDHLHRGLTGPEITKQLLEENPELSAAPAEFWIPLADAQWSLGILEDAVKEKALSIIEQRKTANP